jgi:hypothetical protein
MRMRYDNQKIFPDYHRLNLGQQNITDAQPTLTRSQQLELCIPGSWANAYSDYTG